MSKENLEQFMSKVADSEELQAKVGEEIDAEALITLGAECGCEFTAEELQEAAELSDDELDEVAGGQGRQMSKEDSRPSTRLSWRVICATRHPHIITGRGPYYCAARRKE